MTLSRSELYGYSNSDSHSTTPLSRQKALGELSPTRNDNLVIYRFLGFHVPRLIIHECLIRVGRHHGTSFSTILSYFSVRLNDINFRTGNGHYTRLTSTRASSTSLSASLREQKPVSLIYLFIRTCTIKRSFKS